jgi:hypothetical protein
MGRPFVDHEDADTAEAHMMERHSSLAEFVRSLASKLGISVPWRAVLVCVTDVLRNIEEEDATDKADIAAGRQIRPLRQLIKYGASDVYLCVRNGLERGVWSC